MKFVIVGGVAGGATVAARLRRLDETATIKMFEKGAHVSFSNCALPYRLSDTVKSHNSLVLMNQAKFKKQYNIDAITDTEVIKINRDKKTVTVKNLLTNEEYEESYDKLILAPGANAIVPPIKGIENANIFVLKNVVDTAKLYDYIIEKQVKRITVIGGGFIGVEAAENLKEKGLEVNLVEALPQILKPFDYDMVQILHKEMLDKGVNLIVNDKVVEFKGNDLVLESGKIVEAEAVVMAIGVRPDTKLADEAGIKLNSRGAIEVNTNFQTNDKDIYAIGDAVESFNSITHQKGMLQLAGPAQKQARIAADHIYGKDSFYNGFIGSSAIKVFDYNAASTGLTASEASRLGLSYDYVYIIPTDKVGLMPNAYPLHFKLIYEIPTRRILGAQAISKGEAVKRIDVVATLIKMNGKLEDLKDLELCYAPPFSIARDATNLAALVALNLLNGDFKQVKVSEVRELVENSAYILDVREVNEYERGHLVNAINIPLSELRDRIKEIPTDREVYVHCRSAQRSYNACLALKAHGIDAINISGSFLGICLYEYYNDVTLNRTPIVTEYNFN